MSAWVEWDAGLAAAWFLTFMKGFKLDSTYWKIMLSKITHTRREYNMSEDLASQLSSRGVTLRTAVTRFLQGRE